MKQIVLDFETYYSAEYSLRKMTPVEYILDPRFEVIGCAVKEGDGKAFWLTEAELVDYLSKLPEKVIVVSHNALFDMCILAWRFSYTPYLMADTLGMARAWLGHRFRRFSLDSLSLALKIGVKGTTVHKVMGMTLADIKAAGFYHEYAEYSCGDADLCFGLYRWLIADGFPVSEIAVMDTVIRCTVTPSFVLNPALLAEHLHEVVTSKEALLASVGMTNRDTLMSNDMFAGALRQLGVDPPMKTSLTTGLETYAFAKTDQAFMELEEHPNPLVQALVAARIGVKTTLEETRTSKFMEIANLTWPSNFRPNAPSHQRARLMPMPLRYGAAHTHRLGGEWSLNVQNLPARQNNKIRTAIEAPPGKIVLAVDASQIEARMAAEFCGCSELVMQFANKEDVYSSFASVVFEMVVNKKDNPMERFIGKTAVLGLQYNMGWPKFQKTAIMAAKAQLGLDIELSDDVAARTVQRYRERYRQIPAMWRRLDQLIAAMTRKDCHEWLGPLLFEFERIKLPNGLYLYYSDLHYANGQWQFTYGGIVKYIYGGKLLENIIQALARIHIMDAAIRARKRLEKAGIHLALQVHDELVYVIEERFRAVVEGIVVEEMKRAPIWMPNVPLDSEAGVGTSYAAAK